MPYNIIKTLQYSTGKQLHVHVYQTTLTRTRWSFISVNCDICFICKFYSNKFGDVIYFLTLTLVYFYNLLIKIKFSFCLSHFVYFKV